MKKVFNFSDMNKSDNVDDAIPPILSLIDDHQPENVGQGLDQLLVCFQKFSRAELLKRNWALVIYDALHKVIHEKDTQVIEKLGTALITVLTLVEEDPNENCDKLTKYDDTVKKILFTMELSSDIEQKKAWLPHLVLFVDKMGHATLHWVDRINSMLSDYTGTSCDPQFIALILKCIEALIRNTWIKPSSREWIQIILKILFNRGVLTATESGTDQPNSKAEVYNEVKNCFELISQCEDFSECKEDLNATFKLIKESSQVDLYQQRFLMELDKCDISKLF